MLTNRLLCRTARTPSRGGFTLVELLVVIGIIAILAGVALGPITAGIKKAQQSSGVQTTRTIALAEFQYANDNNQTWPYGTTDASNIAQALIAGNYISDPGIFIIGGSKETKYTGTTASTSIAKTNISYDFVTLASSGLNSNVPDQLPVVLSSIGTATTFTSTAGSVTPVTLTSSNPFGTAGVAVAYKSNSAKFIIANSSNGVANLTDQSWPGQTATTLVGGG